MDELPPTSFAIRPHHLDLLKIFTVVFLELKEQRFPPAYLLHVYRVLMQEIAEVEEPRTHQELIEVLQCGPSAETRIQRAMIERYEQIHEELQTYDSLWAFMKRMPWFVMGNKGDGVNPLFLRKSLFGYFIRRCFASFVKLSFNGVVRLLEDYSAWYRGEKNAGYKYDPKNERDAVNNNAVLFKTIADKQSFGDPAAYTEWEKSMATGDEALAVDNISRYFEQRFTDVRDSKNRQYLLLHVIRMYYLRQEYGAVRKLLQEAITVCRTNGDKIALQHCNAMLHRLPPIERGQKPIMNSVQPELHPYEILYDVKKLMQVQNEQPLSASFEKIVHYLGWYDHWIDIAGNVPNEQELCGHHAVQSVVWSMAGCNQLSSIEENIVTAFTEVGGDDNNRITVALNRAYKRARQGDYDQAICMLLEPDVWKGLNLDDYVAWAGEIWHILVLRASRRGQTRLFREYLEPRRPPGSFSPKEYFFDVNSTYLSIIRDPIHDVIHMRAENQGSVGVDKLLVALWHAEFQCRYGLYRTGLVLLADIALEFGMTKKSRRLLEEIMPQIINGDELEQRALSCFTLARCIISTGYDRGTASQSPESLREALTYLRIAESDYLKLEIYQSVKHVQYLMSVVYHNLGMVGERDVAAKRHFETIEKHEKISGACADKQLVEIFDLMSNVGVALAGRK